MGRIEEDLLREGFDEPTTRITMRHLCSEFVARLERNERLFRLTGAGIIATGLAIFVVTLIGDLFTGKGFTIHWYLVAFGALLVVRGLWLRRRIGVTRAHRWMVEAPKAGTREGGTA